MAISQALTSAFPHYPNQGQMGLFLKLEQFIQDRNQDTCFVLKGYAGTGKTTVISTLVKVLKNIR